MQLLIRDMSKAFPNGVQALRKVSLTIPVGIYGLLGPGGAGKSTLMRILATVQEADSGSARLGELDVLHDKDEACRKLGFLPQDYGVHPQVTAVDLLAHFALLRGLIRHGERREVVEGLLRKVNLWDVRTEKLGALSGGMRQRFGIAVALLGNPRLVIVDEPTAGLDTLERVQFLELLGGLGENSVVILSSRTLEDVCEACKRMAIIDRGEILQECETPRTVAGRNELKDWYFNSVTTTVSAASAAR